MNKVSIKGVVIGSITDNLTSILLGIPVGMYLTYTLMQQGIDPAKLESMLKVMAYSNPLYVVIEFVLGALGSMLGGYVAARIAKHDEVLNGMVAGSLSILTSLYMIFLGGTQSPLWFHMLSVPVSIAAATLGGYVRLRQVRVKQAQA